MQKMQGKQKTPNSFPIKLSHSILVQVWNNKNTMLFLKGIKSQHKKTRI